MADDATDVLVVGGGIGGLAAAFALRRGGHRVRVLEQAAEFGEVGAGLQLAPNATRVLREWGLLERVVATGVLPSRLVLRDAITGDELTHLDVRGDFERRYRGPYVVAHRTDLHRILLEACRDGGVALETTRHVLRVETAGDAVIAHCADGTACRGAVALGVDGLNSTLRRAVVDDEPVGSGYVAYRGTLPLDAAAAEVEADAMVIWIGPGRHFVQYALRRGEVLNQVAVFRSPAFARGEPESDAGADTGADTGTGTDAGMGAELDAAFAGSCEHVTKSLVSMWRDRRWPMYDRAPIGRWTSGRLLLLGDAAHPMLQYLAQGACQAIEDAHVLAAQAAKHSVRGGRVDWPAALAATERVRAPRVGRVQHAARLWGEIWHVDGVGRLIRNELFTTREPQDYRHLDWLYG
jgi:2-polyprenyl-6-methoxyphenol hydroxylase-like FAD-dependent oxidoreductase